MMETGTSVLRKQRKIELAEEKARRREERQAEIAQAEMHGIRSFNLNRRKEMAVATVHVAARRAVHRLNQNDGTGWQVDGTLARVCQRSGPHRSWLCIFHGRKQIALVAIPDMVQKERTSGRRYVTMRFYVGADGCLYRNGLNKIYRVDLMARDWPSEILAVAKKINLICP